MNRLYILRHAKAASSVAGMKDFDRPLETSGLDAALALGKRLHEDGFNPSQIFCSPAMRTRQTLEAVTKTGLFNAPIAYEHDLYSGDWAVYFDIIQKLQTAGPVLIVGHNPSCEEIVQQLVGSGEKDVLRKLFQGFSPATLAIIDFDGPFRDIAPHSGTLKDVWVGGA
jgi:phosphohistidine phosphatase